MNEGSMSHEPEPPASIVGYQLRVMNESFKELKEDITTNFREVRRDLKELPVVYVTRREWEARNVVVDGKVDSKGREIGRLEQKIDNAASHTRGNLALILSGIATLGSIIFGIIALNN